VKLFSLFVGFAHFVKLFFGLFPSTVWEKCGEIIWFELFWFIITTGLGGIILVC
jgi:hypothetical protein